MQLLYTLLILFCCLPGLAQQAPVRISGTVQDSARKPLAGSAVYLLNAEDSSVRKMNAADANGNFVFTTTDPGRYLLKASSIGYEEQYSAPLQLSHQDTTLVLRLSKLTTALETVTVTARRPPLEIKAGRTIVNVDAAPTNAGLNALELLEKSPGVSVDASGNISLKGKGGVLILIDGKPTYLSGSQLSAFLKSLQASSLDQIEIMSNPPAKYEAAGTAGVINIKTKKGMARGMNGSVNANFTQGFYPKYTGGLNFNYRTGKINLFGSYDAGRWKSLSTMYIKRNFYEEGMVSGSSDQQTDRLSNSRWHNVKLGLDYNFSDKDVLGLVVTGRINPWEQTQQGESRLRDAAGNMQSILSSTALNGSQSRNITANFNYKHRFDSSGQELSVDLDRVYYDNEGYNTLETRVRQPDDTPIGNPVLLDGHFPSRISIYSGKLDYVQPFAGKLKLETGLKSSIVQTDNQVLYRRDTSTGWYDDAQRSNHFIYREQINALYASLSAPLGKWELSAGLRAENTISKGEQRKNDSTFRKSYTQLFPNIGLVYNLNDRHQLSFSYSRRIKRPDYEDLNPFIYYIDSLTYGQGNPYLQPQFTHNLELSHSFNRFLTTTLNYTRTSDIITQILKQDTEKKTAFETRENFSNMEQWGLTLTANKQIFKWWHFNLYLNGTSNKFQGLYTDGNKNTPVTLRLNALMTNMTQSFSFAKVWTAELSGWYSTGMSEGLLFIESAGMLNAALARQLFNKKGTLKIGIRDILKTSNLRARSQYADVDIRLRNDRRMDSRQFNVSFTYKFGNNKNGNNRRHTGSATEEQNRVGGGGN